MMLVILAVHFILIHGSLLPSLLLHPLGVCVGSKAAIAACKSYNFFSGIGSDISQITLVGTLVGGALALLKHLNCDAPRCLRYGPHRTADGHHKLCRVHHPDLPKRRQSLESILHHHHKAKEGRIPTTEV